MNYGLITGAEACAKCMGTGWETTTLCTRCLGYGTLTYTLKEIMDAVGKVWAAYPEGFTTFSSMLFNDTTKTSTGYVKRF